MTDHEPASPISPAISPGPQLLRWRPEPEASLFPPREERDAINVWLVELDEGGEEFDDPTLEARYGEILAPDEMIRAKRFVKPLDRVRFARCRSALRMILGHVQQIPPTKVRFGTGPHGKPYLLA